MDFWGPFVRQGFGQRGRLIAAMVLLTWSLSGHAQSASIADADAPTPLAPAPAVTPASVVRTLRLADLGGSPTETLKGVEGLYTWRFGQRLDETIQAARLHLHYTYSPALVPELSHLKILLNGVVTATVPLPRETAGQPQQSTIELPPAFFTDYNQLTIQLIGHYSTGCEDPQHSSLWASINGDSSLELSTRPLDLGLDLARLPAPFFDECDSKTLELPFILPANPSLALLESAGVAASWFGALADYRWAHFPVLRDHLPAGHGVVFATNSQQPPGLQLGLVSTPTISIIANPAAPGYRLLIVQGPDDAALRNATAGLVLGSSLLSGAAAQIKPSELPARRAINDAPRWLRPDRPTRFGELVRALDDLQANGHAPGPIQLSLRMAPDLFTWSRKGAPVRLHYRYTPPTEDDNSLLTVSLNGTVVKSLRLKPGTGSSAEADAKLNVPPYLLDANSSLLMQFAVDYHRPGPCRDSGMDLVRSAIDPEASTIDVSGFSHFAEMPNLRLFANGGFPFTRYADLAETAVVLPPSYSNGDLEAAFQLLGQLGAITGAPGLRLTLSRGDQTQALADKDLLLIGDQPALKEWNQHLPALIEQKNRSSTLLSRARLWFRRGPYPEPLVEGVEGGVEVSATGDLAALVGFESPLHGGRSVVSLQYSSDKARTSALRLLASPGELARIRGDTVIFRGDEINSFWNNSRYGVGRLSLLDWLWLQGSHRPWLLALLVVLAAVFAAGGLYGGLRRLAARRKA